jgi:hypothetical protein
VLQDPFICLHVCYKTHLYICYKTISTVSRNVSFLGLLICMTRCNNSIVGNENGLLGLLFGFVGGGEYSKMVGL